jgi:hypothetical protein
VIAWADPDVRRSFRMIVLLGEGAAVGDLIEWEFPADLTGQVTPGPPPDHAFFNREDGGIAKGRTLGSQCDSCGRLCLSENHG